jgi:hypothetical protein
MKQSIIITASTLFLFSTLFASSVFGESQSDKYLREREACLDVMRIKETKVFDDQTILFEAYGGTVYICRLPARCVGLKISGGFSYDGSMGKLCKQDIIRVVDVGTGPVSTCGMGEFIRMKDINRLRDAVKLLKNGVLEGLVEEGVFETAFPPDRSE